MSWADYNLARQYLLEERIGTRVREAAQIEEAHFNAAKSTMNRG